MKKLQKGFTLIELLAVIAIIGILAALILVSLSRARASARDTQRKAIVRSISQAEESYANNNGSNYALTINALKTAPNDYLQSNLGQQCLPTQGSQTLGDWGTSTCFAATADAYTVKTYLEADPNKGFQCTTGGNCKDI
jgi:prepilin-type N-terminal cleavage/methylation domain-containing protein